MRVIHCLWHERQFYIWAESSDLPISTSDSSKKKKRNSNGNSDQSQYASHPFALSGGNLVKHLEEAVPTRFSEARHQSLNLRLPAGLKGLLPSPWLLREDYLPEKPDRLVDCAVPALAIDAAEAVEFLLSLPLQPPPGTVFSDSVLFWSQLCLLALELVGRQQFVPSLIEDKAIWKAVVDERDDGRWQAFVKSIPYGCLAFSSAWQSYSDGKSQERLSGISPSYLVSSFLDCSVDSLVRGFLSSNGGKAQSSRRGRPPKNAALSQQFLKSLLARRPDEGMLKFSEKEISSFRKDMEAWTEALNSQAQDVAFRTCFRLEAPAFQGDDEIDGEIDGETRSRDKGRDQWTLKIFLQAKDDRSLLVPAEEVWRTRSSALTLLKKRLSNPQEQLLADLGRAERLFPMLNSCLETARPSGLAMKTDEAYNFLRKDAPLLEQNGFGVQLPTWWQRPGSRLGVKLRLLDKPKKESSAASSLFRLDDLVNFDWQLSLGDKVLSEAEFKELSRLKVPLVQMRGEWIELSSQDIEAAIAFFKEKKDRKMPLAEALRLGLDLQGTKPQGIDSRLPVLGLSATGRIEQMLTALSQPATVLKNVPQPDALQGTLRPYQLRGVSWLEYLSNMGLGACLADDMGLGKTVELIAFLLRKKEQETRAETEKKIEAGMQAGTEANSTDPGSFGPALLICPLSVAGNWAREIQRFAPSLSVLTHHGNNRLSGTEFLKEASKRDVVITTYALASKDEETLTSVPWKHVILDEAQSIKNQEARQTQSIKRLNCSNRIALTGTPVENRLSELWSIMDFLNPGYLGSKEAFRKQFTLPIEKYRDRGRSEALRSIIQPFILRRLKTDPTVIRDLPLKMEMNVNYNLTEEQASLYAAVVEEMLGKIEELEGIERRGQILAALTKLKQICNHPALFLQDASSIDGRSGKLARLEEMLYEAQAAGDRSLIFTQFAGMGAMLRHHIQEKMGLEALFLHGKTPRMKREDMIARFQAGSTPVFILSLKAGGFGLNLTAANHVFHFDRWWNPAVENQATDRAFRIGQKKNVFVHKFVCLGTLEEKIDEMIEKKKSLADSVIGTGEAWLTELSNDALKQIFSLRSDAVSSRDPESNSERQ